MKGIIRLYKRAKKVKAILAYLSAEKTSKRQNIDQPKKICYIMVLLQKTYYHAVPPVAKSKNRRCAFLSLALLFVLIALCSLFLGVPHTIWAAEAHVTQSSSSAFEYATPSLYRQGLL